MQPSVRSKLTIARHSILPTLCLLTLSGACAWGSTIVYTGEDLNAGPGSAHPNSTAAAASFDAAASAIGHVSVITFESAPVGAYSSLNLAPGVTLTGSSY